MDRLAMEFICTFGMPPVEHIELVGGLGLRHTGMGPAPIVVLEPGLYPEWSMRGNPALVREVKAALAANGVSVSVGEGFVIMPGLGAEMFAADLDLMAELGASRVNVCCVEVNFDRNLAGFSRLAEMAAERGLDITVEYLPGMTIGTLPAARQLVEQSEQANAGILLDSMHLYRSGATSADIAALPAGMVKYAQLCDVPLVSKFEDYSIEARFERLAPGDGELPLAEYVAALPANVVVGLEIPMRALAERGVGPAERLSPAIAKARALIGD
jgi:sugar phosphate isomerase/epimerase